MWTIEFSRDAAKALMRMPRDQALRIRHRLDELAKDPHGAGNVKKLTDHPGYRLRIGEWRVVYLVHKERVVVQVIRIASRGSAYR